MQPERISLAIAIYNFAGTWMFSGVESEEQAAAFNEGLEEVTVYVAHFLGRDRQCQRSCEDDDDQLFELLLLGAGHSAEHSDKARIIRKGILFLANRTLDIVEDRRGDDPGCDPGCDPGGGMIDPDDRDTDAPW